MSYQITALSVSPAQTINYLVIYLSPKVKSLTLQHKFTTLHQNTLQIQTECYSLSAVLYRNLYTAVRLSPNLHLKCYSSMLAVPCPCCVTPQRGQSLSRYAFTAAGSDVLAEFHYNKLLHKQAAGLASGWKGQSIQSLSAPSNLCRLCQPCYL